MLQAGQAAPAVVLPDADNNQALVGGPNEYQTYQQMRLAKQARERFVAGCEGVMEPLAEAIRARLIELVDQSTSTKEISATTAPARCLAVRVTDLVFVRRSDTRIICM